MCHRHAQIYLEARQVLTHLHKSSKCYIPNHEGYNPHHQEKYLEPCQVFLVETPSLALELPCGKVLLQRSGLKVEDEEESVLIQLVEYGGIVEEGLVRTLWLC